MAPLKKTKVPRSQAAMPKFCQRVIEDVVGNMRQAFLDDGVGEQVLQRMLHMWRSKMMSSQSLDLSPAIPLPNDPMSSNDTGMDADLDLCPSSSVASISVEQEISESLGSAKQLDGALDTSDEETEDNDMSDNDVKEPDGEADSENEGDNNEEPLNSGDDLTDDEDIEAKFETENMVACQYDAVSRSRNKWKFIFRDGMMNIHGKEFLFKRAEGDAIW